MKKKLIVLMLSMSMTAALVSGCGSTAETAVESTATETVQETATEAETADAESDQEAADKVAALIDQIYVQERNDNTDEQCAEAKAAWDALTDAQKELVEGENADPDYFGRDTGDASKDDPLNADEIGENELLVVSFGTSFNDSRAEDIGGIEKALQKAYPDWSVRRAFTAQIIINHVQARDGEKIDNMDQALQRAVDNGVKNLIVQPTHLMHGAEYDELSEAVASYSDKFESVSIAEPLLGEVGSADDSVNSDKEAVAKAVTAEAVKTAGYESLDAAKEDGTAFVFMGHGTSHTANISYSQMQNQMNALGYDNVFIGTVEGEPEDTACEAVIEKIQKAGYKKVILRPLMVVAGDHANNDMAGDGGYISGSKVTEKPEILFARLDVKEVLEKAAVMFEARKALAEEAEEEKEEDVMELTKKPEITFEDFEKMQFAVGEIIKCEPVPKSKKLLCSQVKIGKEVKQIVSGIRAHYTAEEMVGKKVMVLVNLKPAKLAGVLSEGMLLCAEDAEGNLALVTPEKNMPAGAEIC